MVDNVDAQPRRRPTTYWLIVKRGAGQAEQEERLILNSGNVRTALAVFSFEEEADMFLSLGPLGAEWGLARVTVGELTDILLGPCAGIRFVALDPLPELIGRGMIELVNLRRERFVKRLTENAPESPLVAL